MLQQSIRAQVARILNRKEPRGDKTNPNLFHDIIDSKLPRSDLTLERLTDEAISVTVQAWKLPNEP